MMKSDISRPDPYVLLMKSDISRPDPYVLMFFSCCALGPPLNRGVGLKEIYEPSIRASDL